MASPVVGETACVE